MSKQAVGLTKDAGWQFGIRKSFPISVEVAWEFLLSQEGLAIWLGHVKPKSWEIGKAYETAEGTEFKITILEPYSHMRMAWKKKGWDHFSMLQPRVIKGIRKATISFHHDKLKNASQREAMKKHWEGVMEQIVTKFDRTG